MPPPRAQCGEDSRGSVLVRGSWARPTLERGDEKVERDGIMVGRQGLESFAAAEALRKATLAGREAGFGDRVMSCLAFSSIHWIRCGSRVWG